jgi:DNA-binding NtrC family response regulator
MPERSADSRDACRLRREGEPPERRLARRLKEKVGLRSLVGESPAFVAEIGKIPRVARCDVGVLISGETGTGKELVARAIHYLSRRSKGPFVPVNCGAIPVDLVENELFGHERSAYTGADSARSGLLEEADGGTLFLDEVDSLAPVAQVKLLRFLQDKELRRLGSTKVRRSDLRVIAATNADVETALEGGRLRRDLYYRLNVVPLTLPPLRRRPEDVPLLARHFLARYGAELGRPDAELSDEAMHALSVHDWPGNVRELEHVIQRALVLSPPGTIGPGEALLSENGDRGRPTSFKDAKARVVARFEKGYLERALAAHGGNISRAARSAEKHRRAFFELIRKHGIDVARFRSGSRRD